MFSNSLSVVTALTMLAHSVWGCCWHHPHDDGCAQTGVVSVAGEHDHAGEHAHAACSHSRPHVDSIVQTAITEAGVCDHDSHEEDGQHHGQCSETRCSFVKTAPVNIDGLWDAPAMTMPLDNVFIANTFAGRRSEVDNPATLRMAPSVCAVTQRWLL